MTLSLFDVRPSCDTADVQAILPFPPNHLKHVLCDFPDCGVLMRSRNSGSVFGVEGRKHCPWRNSKGRNHTHCQVWWPGWPSAECVRCTTNTSTWQVSHERRTSNTFMVTMKLQTFLFQMVVTSCISVQYLWKYGFAKSSDNLYATCSINSKRQFLDYATATFSKRYIS